MAFRALIFDFDGTIADTLEEARHIYNRLAPEYKLRTVEAAEVAELRHLTLSGFIDHLKIPKRKVPMILARGTMMLRASIARLPLIPGMAEVLPDLRKHAHTFGILTSNAAENVELFLHAHGIRDLFTFISSTSKLTGKSRHLAAIKRTFSLNPAEMIYIGDEVRDINSARKAGIAVAGVSWGFNSAEALHEAGPTVVLTQPSELMSLI